MPKLLDRIAASPLLWLEDSDYSARLLAGGQAPWLDVAGLVAWRRKAQGLLKSDVAVLDLAGLSAAWIAARPALREAMAAGKRVGAPLRTLLADEDLRAHIGEALRGLRDSFPQQLLALRLPSPRQWLADARAAVSGSRPAADGDEIDAAAVYVADFLRAFGGSGIDALLLTEAANDVPAAAEELAWYEAVLNLAHHYRWDVGLQFPALADAIDDGAVAAFDFVVAPRALGAHVGLLLPGEFWSGGAAAPVPAGGFLYGVVPADAQPEAVLQALAQLR